ncbi:hypothetical protein IPM65_02340 [Candidatus Roizmanbacteria bacterium]|nr:MAG: hypothetical protein IPM65_02340 [Candidatus Roizmanbacteria bacterium]
MKYWHSVIIPIILFGAGFYWWNITNPIPETEVRESTYVVTGSANPGEIVLYKAENDTLIEQKRVDTGYKFVFTVRIGDIYHTGENTIIAGVGDSFYKDPYGCHVVSYDLELKITETIDTLSDLRCKDLTIADMDRDGENEVILATHGQGNILMYKHVAGEWQKEQIEHNYIAMFDEQNGQNHRVPNEDLPCESCIVQSAVHIVKAADIDGRGDLELLATISSPLELQEVDEVSFIMMYRRKEGVWEKEVIDQANNLEFRSIELGDIDQNGVQDIIVGTGSPREVPSSIIAYEYTDGVWQKKEVYTDPKVKNMKGLAISDYEQDGRDSIILATGFPESILYQLAWDGAGFSVKELAKISSVVQNGGQHNAMAAVVLPQSKNIITAGMSTFPEKKIGWEASDTGFLVYHTNNNGTLSSQIIDTPNILGMDLFTK